LLGKFYFGYIRLEMKIVVVHVSYKLHPDFYVLLQFEIFHPIDHNGKDKSEGVWIFFKDVCQKSV